MADQEPARPRRSQRSRSPQRDDGPVRWEVRRHRKPWQKFLERFGFTLIALGVAMFVGVMIARLG